MTQDRIQELREEIKALKKGVSFWATKKSPDLKKRKVKVRFKYNRQNEFIRIKEAELKGRLDERATIKREVERIASTTWYDTKCKFCQIHKKKFDEIIGSLQKGEEEK